MQTTHTVIVGSKDDDFRATRSIQKLEVVIESPSKEYAEQFLPFLCEHAELDSFSAGQTAFELLSRSNKEFTEVNWDDDIHDWMCEVDAYVNHRERTDEDDFDITPTMVEDTKKVVIISVRQLKEAYGAMVE